MGAKSVMSWVVFCCNRNTNFEEGEDYERASEPNHLHNTSQPQMYGIVGDLQTTGIQLSLSLHRYPPPYLQDLFQEALAKLFASAPNDSLWDQILPRPSHEMRVGILLHALSDDGNQRGEVALEGFGNGHQLFCALVDVEGNATDVGMGRGDALVFLVQEPELVESFDDQILEGVIGKRNSYWEVYGVLGE